MPCKVECNVIPLRVTYSVLRDVVHSVVEHGEVQVNRHDIEVKREVKEELERD